MWEHIFTAGAVFALIGGALGGGIATSTVKDGVFRSTLTVLMGAACAAGVGDYLNLLDRHWVALFVGLVVGVLAPRVITVLDAMVPEFLPRVLPHLLDRLADFWLGRKK